MFLCKTSSVFSANESQTKAGIFTFYIVEVDCKVCTTSENVPGWFLQCRCQNTHLVTDKELVYYMYITAIVKSWSFCVTFL